MPDPRPLAVSLLAGLGVAAFTILWWHWPLVVGGVVGLVVGGLALLGTISIGGDPSAADAAWRAAAPDLLDEPAEPRTINVRPRDEAN